MTSYVPKSSKITDLAEARWFEFAKVQKVSQKKSTHGKPKDVNMEKLLPTDGAFLLHYLRSAVQTRTWYETTKARINHVNPQGYSWKPLDEGFTAISMEDDIFSELLLIVCGCQSCNCECATAAQISSLSRICVVSASNFVKILIRRKF